MLTRLICVVGANEKRIGPYAFDACSRKAMPARHELQTHAVVCDISTRGDAADTCAAERQRHGCSPGGDCDDLRARLQRQLAHADQVLRDLREPLLVLVHQELGPERQVLIDLRHIGHAVRSGSAMCGLKHRQKDILRVLQTLDLTRRNEVKRRQNRCRASPARAPVRTAA